MSSTFQVLSSRIILKWEGHPAVNLVVKEISKRSELPSEKKCPKNHLYIGVIHKKNNDKIIVVKQEITLNADLKCRAAELSDKELSWLGVLPKPPFNCIQCGEFSPRIGTDLLCYECSSKGNK